jgi:hypothetical protein
MNVGALDVLLPGASLPERRRRSTGSVFGVDRAIYDRAAVLVVVEADTFPGLSKSTLAILSDRSRRRQSST